MKKAFSLMEVIITAALFAVIFSGIFINFQRTSHLQTLNNQAERVRQAFTVARTSALNGKKDCSFCGATGGLCGNGDVPLQGWLVVTQSNRVTVQGICSATGYPPIAPDLVRTWNDGSITIEPVSGVTVTSSTQIVLFRPVGGGIWPPAVGNLPITVTISGWGWNRTFTIDPAGVISQLN